MGSLHCPYVDDTTCSSRLQVETMLGNGVVTLVKALPDLKTRSPPPQPPNKPSKIRFPTSFTENNPFPSRKRNSNSNTQRLVIIILVLQTTKKKKLTIDNKNDFHIWKS